MADRIVGAAVGSSASEVPQYPARRSSCANPNQLQQLQRIAGGGHAIVHAIVESHLSVFRKRLFEMHGIADFR